MVFDRWAQVSIELMMALHIYNDVYCREKIGNFKTEPPGLFRGRGEHPKQGMVKVSTTASFVLLSDL